MEPTTPQAASPVSPTQKRNYFLFGFVFILIVGCAGIVWYFMNASTKQMTKSIPKITTKTASLPVPTNTPKQPTDWKKPSSTKQGFPLLKREGNGNGEANAFRLSIYSLPNQIVKDTAFITNDYGGASGFGNTEPIPSPNLLYTAYIDHKSNNLYLLSNETLETKQITSTGHVDYITGWSPNSQNILYYIGPNTITTATRGYGRPQNSVPFLKNAISGFFLFNIDSGETISLYPVGYVETFIDDTTLLTRTDDAVNDKLLIPFDFSTFTADFGKIKGEYGYGASQFRFTSNGKYWTYTLSRNPTTDANIVYAPFPQAEAVTIDQGGWADVQWPILSPKGSRIMYAKREGQTTIWVYNTQTNDKGKATDGWPTMWIDETELIGYVRDTDTNTLNYFIYNVTTQQLTKMQ